MSSQPSSASGSGGQTKPAGLFSRVNILAVLAVLSVVALVDSEIVAYGVPGIVAAFNMLQLPVMFTYGAIGVLSLLTLWLTVHLVRAVWRVEHELDAAQRAPTGMPPAC